MDNISEIIKKLPIAFWAELIGNVSRQTFYNYLEKFKGENLSGEEKRKFNLISNLTSKMDLKDFTLESFRNKIKEEIQRLDQLNKLDNSYSVDINSDIENEIITNFNKLLILNSYSEYVIIRNSFDHFAANVLKAYLLAYSISPELIDAPAFERKYFNNNVIPRRLFIIGGPGANQFTKVYQYHPHKDFSTGDSKVIEIETNASGMIWLIYDNKILPLTDENAAMYRFLDLVKKEQIQIH